MKAARPVRRGADGKVLRVTGVTRRRPTLLFRPATEAERNDLSVTLYCHTLPDGGSTLVRRITVANRAELITAYCVPCAQSFPTSQVLCYQRNLAIGEVVGLQKNGYEPNSIAA